MADCLRLVNRVWWTCLFGAPASGMAVPTLALLFGSYPLGRALVDVDVCMLMPEYVSQQDAASRLVRFCCCSRGRDGSSVHGIHRIGGVAGMILFAARRGTFAWHSLMLFVALVP